MINLAPITKSSTSKITIVDGLNRNRVSIKQIAHIK